jgi:hypothetical protein
LIIRRAVRLLLLFAAIEAMSFGFAKLSIWRGNPFLFFYADLFEHVDPALAKFERDGSITGWPLTNDPRQQPARQPATCGSAMGGSFTYSTGVADDETWPSYLSEKLGCNIDNFGADGFGVDQSEIRHSSLDRHDRVVVFGLIPGMIIPDSIASWTFYDRGVDHLPRPNLTKPFFVLNGEKLELIPRPPFDPNAILAHHRFDLFRSMWTPLRFPFSYSVAAAIYRHFTIPNYWNMNVYDNSLTSVGMRKRGWTILRTMQAEVKSHGGELVVVLVESPDLTPGENPPYAPILTELRRELSGVCLIDPFPALHALSEKIGAPGMRNTSGHYSAAGNNVIASEVAKGIASCGIKL